MLIICILFGQMVLSTFMEKSCNPDLEKKKNFQRQGLFLICVIEACAQIQDGYFIGHESYNRSLA